MGQPRGGRTAEGGGWLRAQPGAAGEITALLGIHKAQCSLSLQREHCGERDAVEEVTADDTQGNP